MDFAENVSRGHDRWREPYVAQRQQKRAQIDQMMRYAESTQCRMGALVSHFGDLADGQKPCGICDFCAPGECTAQRFRHATEAERAAFLRVVRALRTGGTKSTGKLYGEQYPAHEFSRDAFEEVLGAMARTGLVQISDAVFEKDGKPIAYRTARLTEAGYAIGERTPGEFIVKDTARPSAERPRKKKSTVSVSRTRAQHLDTATRPSLAASASRSEVGADSPLEAALRVWRLHEARRRGVPAFRIFSDRILRALAATRPRTPAELLAISGVGLSTAEKYGPEICRVVREHGD